MKILMTGNREKDLCAVLVPLLEARGHQCTCVSRASGHDFEKGDGTIANVVKLAETHDVFINLYANYFFKASLLAHKIYTRWHQNGSSEKLLINIGSTTDRVKKGKTKLYHYEKRALRDLSSGLALIGVWENGPKVSHISFGTLSNRKDQNPGRQCLSLEAAAQYIIWVLEQPKDRTINEISIDPVQS